MKKWNNLNQEIKFHLSLHFLIAIFITIASYVHLPFGSLKGNLVYFVHFLLLHFSLFGFLYIASLFSRIFKIILPVLFIIVTSLSFWVYTQDLTIGVGLIQAILETNLDIAIDVISFPFILFLSTATFFIIFFMRFYKNYKISNVKSPLFYVAILGVLSFFVVEHYKFDAFKNRLPYSVYFGTLTYFDSPKIKLKQVNQKAFTQEDNLHIVLVMGESVRAKNLSLNGYDRNTNPLLSNRNNIISFKNVYTPFTYTAISLPQILTDKSIESKKNIEKATSLYAVLNKASFKTEWIGNQSLEKSYKDIIYSNTTHTIIDKFHSFLSFKKEKDLALLDYFSLDDTAEGNKISTLHMIGSHWYYNSRITDDFQYFKPIISSKFIGSLKKEELVNSYDNTIIYLDYFLDQLIQKIEKSNKKTILIYISDHGENLGEDGKWLHSQEHKASKNPAMLVWFSDNFEKSYPLKINQLKLKQRDSITTDFLFHSVLDLAEIKNYKYDKTKSVFDK